VKEQASVAASAAKEAAQKGQAKVGEVQAKRAADGVLRQLGLAAYLQQAGRASAGVDDDIAAGRFGDLRLERVVRAIDAVFPKDRLEECDTAAVSVQTLDGQVFDAIVYAEQEPARWMAGTKKR